MQRTPSKVNHWINIQSTCSVTWSWKEAFIEYLVMISHKVFPYIQLLNSSKVKVPTLAKHYSGKCNKLWHVKKFFFKSEKHLNQELYRNRYKLSVILTYLLLITTTETQFDPRIGKSPWRRKWQATPVLLSGESHRQRSPVGYSPQHHKESETTQHTRTQIRILKQSHSLLAIYSHAKLLQCYWPYSLLCMLPTVSYLHTTGALCLSIPIT